MICLWAGNLMAHFGKMSIPTPCPASPSSPPQVKREMWSLFNFLGGGDIWPQMGMFVWGSGEFEFEFWPIHIKFALTSFLIHINCRKKKEYRLPKKTSLRLDIYRFTVTKNSCVHWGQEAYLTLKAALIQCSRLFSYEEASKAWNKQLTTLINLYRWSITFYHYLLNTIKLSNLKKQTNKQTDLAIHCYKKNLPEKLSHVLSLLGPSILLGQSAKKIGMTIRENWMRKVDRIIGRKSRFALFLWYQ